MAREYEVAQKTMKLEINHLKPHTILPTYKCFVARLRSIFLWIRASSKGLLHFSLCTCISHHQLVSFSNEIELTQVWLKDKYLAFVLMLTCTLKK